MWAVEECNADIITLPLGMARRYDSIDHALQIAWSLKKIVFAATSNAGSNRIPSYPASDSSVIAISATNGYGNAAPFNPSPLNNRDNFATLGVDIESRWQGETVYKSGTSFAAALAAGIAASFLEYARWKVELRSASDRAWICSTDGMRSMFRLMSKSISGDRGFRYVAPWFLFNERDRDDRRIQAVILYNVLNR